MGRLTVTCKKNDYDKCSICGANTIFKWHKVEDCLRNLEAQKMELQAENAKLREALKNVKSLTMLADEYTWDDDMQKIHNIAQEALK